MEKRDKLIHLRVTQKEYDIISRNARNVHMRVAPYIRTTATLGKIITFNYSVLYKHTQMLSQIHDEMDNLLFESNLQVNGRSVYAIMGLWEKVFDLENEMYRLLMEDIQARRAPLGDEVVSYCGDNDSTQADTGKVSNTENENS